MEYEDLYDESPYTNKVVPRQGGMMSSIRATLLICATILASVFGITLYGYQQDQFVISSNANYVAIFDKKFKTLNMCDKGSCTLMAPNFEVHTMVQGMGPQGGTPQQGPVGPNGQRIVGTFPQSQQMPNPQMMPQGGMPQQMMNPQMMQQRGMMPQQMPNPMVQQMQQRGAAPQQMGNPQMIRGAPQPIQGQVTGGAPANQATPAPTADATAAGDGASTDAADSDATTIDDAAAPASDDATEEPAPI